MNIRTIVTGVSGRMGRTIVRALHEARADFEFVGATERLESPAVGQDAGLVCGIGENHVIIRPALREVLAETKADVVIDFSHHEASMAHARLCAASSTALVIGTTGFTAEEMSELKKLSSKLPLLVAPNMSTGVVVMQALIRQAARILGSAYDVEVLEMHHRHKRDAPSGTALKIGHIAAEALGRNPEQCLKLSREGLIGPRPEGEIGIQSLRGGDCIGEHTAFFFGAGERLEITHRAFSREQFAAGALSAARFLSGRAPGFYEMEDVLGIER